MKLQAFPLKVLSTLLLLCAFTSKADTLLVVEFEGNHHVITKKVEVLSALSKNKQQLKTSLQQRSTLSSTTTASIIGFADSQAFELAVPNILTVYAPLSEGQGHTAAQLQSGAYRLRLPTDKLDIESLSLVIRSGNDNGKVQKTIKLSNAL